MISGKHIGRNSPKAPVTFLSTIISTPDLTASELHGIWRLDVLRLSGYRSWTLFRRDAQGSPCYSLNVKVHNNPTICFYQSHWDILSRLVKYFDRRDAWTRIYYILGVTYGGRSRIYLVKYIHNHCVLSVVLVLELISCGSMGCI